LIRSVSRDYRPCKLKRFILLAAILTLAAVAACVSRSSPGRVIVLGLDGLDPATVDLLMSEGKLPHFAKMRQEGAYAPLESAKPLLSPVVWTTIATGKLPQQHGIGHFVAIKQDTGEQLPVTSRMRRVKALWNILSDAKRTVSVVGWWATWPPEPVRGSVVSDHFAYHFLFDQGLRGESEGGPKTYPPELEKTLAPLVKRPQDLTPADAAPFVNVDPAEWNRPFDLSDDLSSFKWALAAAETYSAIGLRQWKTEKPDTLFVYIEATDSVAHLYGHLFRAKGLGGELAEQQKRFGQAVEQMYLRADRLVGQFMDAMDRRTTLVVLSDHGFELGALPADPSTTRDMRRVSEIYHRLHGVLYLYGNRVKRYGKPQQPTIRDIAPTVLALNGVAPAADMPGRVLTEALDVTVPPRVPTYETGAGELASSAPEADPRVDAEAVKRLQSLGYIGAKSPTGDRNIAGMKFEAGRYAEAAADYKRLVEAKPDDSGLRASYAGSLGALGRYDEALRELDAAIRLDPINVEAYHNRAVIHERQGDRAGAVRDYQNALRYNPQYAPSKEALARLGAPADPHAPKTDAERRAFALAEQASDSARRANYAEAMEKLDAAEKIAPRYALLYQYRANVAYLMGDKPRAIVALKRGLELEPDNALFRQNLKRLEHP
jgi:tetratricopeptide (TPR) repeat protein